MEKHLWILTVLALLVGMTFGGLFTNLLTPTKTVTEYVDVPFEVLKEVEVIKEVPIEVPAPSENFWTDLAWAQVLDEYDSEDEFFTCGGHEFDDDEMSTELEDHSVEISKSGDVTVSGSWEFEFEDDSDERDCKVDRSFEVFWDDDDVEDADWNEAEVSGL